ncbi:fibronectin leucine rich transmembrane protein 3, isoform CRA_b [Mus musculus]|uniref:Uncharacterized protein n=2 Tax=Mus TaxID=862507 RepID=Q3V411_MOUSE|nr:fibronectin leucine rich transmembrane protein 3, isoform CRA_b [Mus musculus]BAE43261.1 unnamed protein product [Mus musculus]
MPRSGDGGGFLLQLTGNGITAVAAGYKGLLFPRLPGGAQSWPILRTRNIKGI